jgi:very-short-patch-repair endonuclease
MNRRKELATIICAECGSLTFVPPWRGPNGRNPRLYCNRKCYEKSLQRKVERVCPQCKQIFFTTPSVVEKGKGVYCSRACFDITLHARILDEKIAALYLVEGKDIADIARELGVTGMSIHHRMKKAGIPRRNRSESSRGERNGMFGRTHNAQSRQKIREANFIQFSDPAARERHGIITAIQIAEGRTGKTNNKLEQHFTKLLQSLHIKYQQSYRIGRSIYDFYLPDIHTLVECDGTFWHADPRTYPDRTKLSKVQQKNVENDARKNKLAEDKGFQLLRFWEHDIYHESDQIIETLVEKGQTRTEVLWLNAKAQRRQRGLFDDANFAG